LERNNKQYLTGIGLIIAASVVLYLIINYVPLDPTKEEVIPVEEKIHYEDKDFNNELVDDNQNLVKRSDTISKIEPTFDIVNVDEDGQAVIAGRASANSSVKIYNEDKLIGEVQTNQYGEFVFIPDENFKPGNYELKLLSNGKESKETVSIIVPNNKAASDLGSEPVVVLSDQEGIVKKVIQGSIENLDTKDLSFDALSYSEEGTLNLSGKARPGAKVEAYVDGKLVGETMTREDGFWNMILEKPVNPGDYTLRFNQLEDERIVSSLETPIRQSDLKEVNLDDKTYIVQPGNSLWRISRRYYGKGIMYTIIFAKNNDQIENPHLIYPGQIFKIPDSEKE